LASPQGQSPIKEVMKEAVPALEVHGCGKDAFDGSWTHGVIAGDKLTWNDGTISHVAIDETAGIVEVTYHGNSFNGAMREDGNIHWSNGDIWCRQSEASPVNLETLASDAPSAHTAVHPCSPEIIESSNPMNATGQALEESSEKIVSVPSLSQTSSLHDEGKPILVSAQVNVADDASQSEVVAEGQTAGQMETDSATSRGQPSGEQGAVVQKDKDLTCQAGAHIINPPAAPRKERAWGCC
jgi:hypothetical protein